MIETTEKIIFEGQEFVGRTTEIGFINGHFRFSSRYPEGGSYSTSIPISPLSYRLEYPTKTKFKDDGDQLIIASDHGETSTIQASRHIILSLIDECLEQQIPEYR